MSALGPKKIYIAARRITELERVKGLCSTACEIEVIQLDLSDPDKCLEFAETFKDNIDILVNNGGLSNREQFVDCKLLIAKHLMNVNCLSPIALIKGFLPRLIESGAGQVVNVLSVAGTVGVPVRAYYSASKFALDGFGKAIAGELTAHNINVLQVYPGYVKTNISMNAMIGNGEKMGEMDKNIAKGITVQEAVDDLIKAMYLRRHQLVIGGLYYWVAPRFLNLSETIYRLYGKWYMKKQLKACEISNI